MRVETGFYLLNMSQKADTSGLRGGTEYHIFGIKFGLNPFLNQFFGLFLWF